MEGKGVARRSECRAVATLVPLTALSLLALPPLNPEQQVPPMFDFESWGAKVYIYAQVNPRTLTMNKSDIIKWAGRFVDFEPFSVLPFTPTFTCEPRTSRLIDRFDWRLLPDVDKRVDDEAAPKDPDTVCGPLDELPWRFEERVKGSKDVRTVYATPHALPLLLERAAAHLDERQAADRVLLFSGTEMPLSHAFGYTDAARAATLSKLRKYFGRVVYQTKDIPMKGVHLAPMGLSWGYTTLLVGQLSGWPAPYFFFGEFAMNVFARASIHSKPREVFAAWGRVAGWLERPRTPQRCRELAKGMKLFPPSNSSLRAVLSAGGSRKQLRAWLNSSAAAAVGAEMHSLKPYQYWEELPKYKFLLAPMGSNIQTAKNIEALMALTIPIVQHMEFSLFPELVAMGFPLVLVDSWSDVTPANTTAWWRALSPRLASFRRNCLTIEGYWSMYIGQVETCV